jgi:hypothetical protein
MEIRLDERSEPAPLELPEEGRIDLARTDLARADLAVVRHAGSA